MRIAVQNCDGVGITFGVSVVVAACLTAAAAKIYKHELVDGKVYEISCESLDDCLTKGVSTPGMLLHRKWANDIRDALGKRAASITGANRSRLLARQSHVRRLFQRLLRARTEPSETPRFRQLRRFEDPERKVSVTMLVFESWANHSVPAVMVAPLGVERAGRLSPGILHVPGHLAPGLRDPEEQRMWLSLAQKGYTVLTFDPLSQGERLLYDESEGLECQTTYRAKNDVCQSAGPPCSTAHDHLGKQLWLTGRSLAEFFVQDAQRAIDFLVRIPWVDPSQIGVVGCSGGGAITAYLGAVDNRVGVVSIACYFSTLAEELERGTCNYDAEQIIWGQARLGLDKPDLLVARAPRPGIVILTTDDCFPFSGAQEGWKEISPAYRMYQPKLANSGGHFFGISRSDSSGYHGVTEVGINATHTTFNDYMQPLPTEIPVDTSPFPCHSLWFGQAQMAMGYDGKKPLPIQRMLEHIARPLLSKIRGWRHLPPGRWLASLPWQSAVTAGLDLPRALHKSSAVPLPVAKVVWNPGGREEWHMVPTVHACTVTLRLFRLQSSNEAPGGPLPQGETLAMLVGGPIELNRDLTELEKGLLQILIQLHRIHVVFVGLCGFGDDMWRGGLWEFAPFLLSKTNVGFHAEELIRSFRWAVDTLQASRIVLVSVGDHRTNPDSGATEPKVAPGGSAAAILHAAVHLVRSDMSAAFAGLVFLGELLNLAAVAVAKRHRLPWSMLMFGTLEHYDLEDLLAATAAKTGPHCLIIDPKTPAGSTLSRWRALREFAFARKVYRNAGRHLRVVLSREWLGKMPYWRDHLYAKIVSDFIASAAR